MVDSNIINEMATERQISKLICFFFMKVNRFHLGLNGHVAALKWSINEYLPNMIFSLIFEWRKTKPTKEQVEIQVTLIWFFHIFFLNNAQQTAVIIHIFSIDQWSSHKAQIWYNFIERLNSKAVYKYSLLLSTLVCWWNQVSENGSAQCYCSCDKFSIRNLHTEISGRHKVFKGLRRLHRTE